MIEARKKINDAYNAYQQDTSEEKRLIYKQAKKSLETTYNDVLEKDLTSKLKEVEMAQVNSKHGQSWRHINDISGRKASAKGQLKGDTQKERVKNWFNHFKDLLGSNPDICWWRRKNYTCIGRNWYQDMTIWSRRVWKGKEIIGGREELWRRWYITWGFEKMWHGCDYLKLL